MKQYLLIYRRKCCHQSPLSVVAGMFVAMTKECYC